MDVSSVAASAVSQTAQNRDASVELHKKALEVQEQTAQQLIQSVPDPSSPIGQNIDVTV